MDRDPESPNVAEEAEHTSQAAETAETADAAASQTADGSSTASHTGATDYITALQAEIEELRTRAEEAEKKVLYLQAEFQTYRRRRDEEQSGLQKYANSELIKSLLPVIDNFERALKAAEQAKNFDALIGGVSGTHKQLAAALEKAGVKTIEAVGKEFDPNYHEAIGHTESDLPANTVAEEVQRGYILHDRVLRPSLVKVSEG